MPLERKRESESIPQYSLTGDLLSFLRCGLQYRYHSGSALPPSRPVQLWFGEFIHGIMESAYRLWRAGQVPALPWPCHPTRWRQAPPPRLPHDIGTLGDIVESALRAQGKVPRSTAARESAYRRAERAVNELGPHLFPLIASAEQRVTGTRQVPPLPAEAAHLPVRARRYELQGVIDVLTDVQLTGAHSSNVICQAIQEVCPGLSGRFEVIVDYKGSRRPPTPHPYWQQGLWQLQTYAWLRTRQPQALPVVAGVLLYINELLPVQADLAELKREVRREETEVLPERGSLDERYLSAWQPGSAIPEFSLAYRLRRAIRVVPVSPASQAEAAAWFDQVVLRIERCVGAEAAGGSILRHWEPGGDEPTCNACDFRHFCPNPAPRSERPPPSRPAPAAP